jgi:SAM-dependent methyltransferase
MSNVGTWSPALENVSDFYNWVTASIVAAGLPRNARIVDVGCGSGALLSRLVSRGYTNLTGVDITIGSLALATNQASAARLSLHDIEAGPLTERYDAVLMTTVIEFLADPGRALSNVRTSLADDGVLFLTMRNRFAYFPWYHFRSLDRVFRFSPWLRYWFRWFTTPLPMHPNDQSTERIYTSQEMRRLLSRHGFQVVDERGAQILPMLWIPGFPPALWSMRTLNQMMQRLPASPLSFQYMFICKKAWHD